MAQTSNVWDAHGRLQVSANNRYLQHSDGTPFLWLGGTAWGMGTRTTRQDVDTYLNNRQAKGFTLVQAVVHWDYEYNNGLWTHTQFTRNPANGYGHRPFPGPADNPDTGNPQGAVVAGGSPDDPNDFYDHIDYIVRETRARGMALALLPTWGRRFIGAPSGTGDVIEYNAAEAQAYGQFLGERYGNQPHLIWTLGGDTAGVTSGGDKRPIYRAMAQGIQMGVTAAGGGAPLMTFHPDSVSTHFINDPWHSFNMIQTGQTNLTTVHSMVRMEYSRTSPVKPVINAEPPYEGVTWWAKPPLTKSALDVRRAAYQSFFSGAAGYTYGRGPSSQAAIDPVWNFGVGTGGETWKNLLDSPGAQAMAHLKTFLAAHEWWKWVPDQSIILGDGFDTNRADANQQIGGGVGDVVLTGSSGSGATLKTAVRSIDGDALLVYFPDETGATISLSALTSDDYAIARWFNPENGSWLEAERIDATSGTFSFTPPVNWADAVLRVQAVPEPAPPTSSSTSSNLPGSTARS